MNLDEMTKDERSLLLFFETCAVDYSGRVNVERMNDDDIQIAECWHENDFVSFGRIRVKDHNRQGTNWVELSEDAWSLAHQERRARHARNPRRYERTCDTRGHDHD